MCPLGGGCSTVLSSDYATVFGIPLTLVGTLKAHPLPHPAVLLHYDI